MSWFKPVLANEKVINGKSERGAYPVFRVHMKQWMIRITAYADRLLKELDRLDWPEGTKELQRNWIGRRTRNYFPVENHQKRFQYLQLEERFGVTFFSSCSRAPLDFGVGPSRSKRRSKTLH